MLNKDLIERRTALLAEIEGIPIDRPDDFDRKTAELRAVESRLKFAAERDAADRGAPASPVAAAAAAPECRAFHGARSTLPAAFNGSLWRTAEGLPVPALGPADRLADFAPADESGASELGIAGFLRLLSRGAQTGLERRVLAGATVGTGGAAVPTPLAAGVIDLLRARSVTIQAGARTIPMDSATLRIARQTADPVGGWRAENAAIAESDPVFDQVTLTARSWALRVSLSRELLEDGQNVDGVINNILAQAGAAALDQAALVGSGAAGQPLGIRGQAGIQNLIMGANGATLTNWLQPLNAVAALEAANAGTISAMALHPRTARAIYGLVDSTGQPLQPPPRLANVPVLTSTAVPVNEVQGSSGAVASSIFMGDFNEVLIGMRTELQIQVLTERFAEIGQVCFVAWLRADVALARPAAIARIAGILA